MLYTVLRTLIVALGCTAAGVATMHMLQAQRYQIPELRRLLRRYGDKTLRPDVLIAAAVAVIDWYLPILLAMVIQKEEFREDLCRWLVLGLFAIVAAVLFWLRLRLPMKKPFVVTRRMFRLILLVFSINLAGCIILPLLSITPYLLFAGADYIVLAAAVMLRPLEDRINAGFYNSARSKLAKRSDMIRIGITGSFGKTACKQILKTLLSEKYRVLATPPSFSTAMGVSRVVNEQLKPEHQVFIAEMGARHVGDIRELVDLVHPSIGLITSVGPQHLDTFGTVERVRDTKYELIEGLPQEGIAVFARDGAHCDALYARCPLAAKYRPGDLVEASGVEAGPWGTRFTLTDVQTGESRQMETRLLGEHSIANLLLCCTAAKALGMTLEEIALGVSRCEPVEHRLQLISGAGGVSIIDDAFNANPVGVQAALRVLKHFPGRRIIVTPGMVELGGREEEFNRAFGTQMASSVDIAILVGKKHTRPIAEGLLAAGFDESNLHVVGCLGESTELLHTMMRAGDVVLYENDLPDNYSE